MILGGQLAKSLALTKELFKMQSGGKKTPKAFPNLNGGTTANNAYEVSNVLVPILLEAAAKLSGNRAIFILDCDSATSCHVSSP